MDVYNNYNNSPDQKSYNNEQININYDKNNIENINKN